MSHFVTCDQTIEFKPRKLHSNWSFKWTVPIELYVFRLLRLYSRSQANDLHKNLLPFSLLYMIRVSFFSSEISTLCQKIITSTAIAVVQRYRFFCLINCLNIEKQWASHGDTPQKELKSFGWPGGSNIVEFRGMTNELCEGMQVIMRIPCAYLEWKHFINVIIPKQKTSNLGKMEE